MLLKSKRKKRDAAWQHTGVGRSQSWLSRFGLDGACVVPGCSVILGDGDRASSHQWIARIGIPNGEGP